MIEVYTDGSCKNNPGVGSCGYIIYNNGVFIRSYVEFEAEITTNNIMELKSIYKALEYLNEQNLHTTTCTLFTDSQYANNGLSKWIYTWIKNSWQTSEQKPVLNKILWQLLFNTYKKFTNIKIEWIRAHTNNLDIHSIRNKYIDALIQ